MEIDIETDRLAEVASFLVPAYEWSAEMSLAHQEIFDRPATTMARVHAIRSAFGSLVQQNCPSWKVINDYVELGKVEIRSEATGIHWILRSAKQQQREIRHRFVQDPLPDFEEDLQTVGLLFYEVRGATIVLTAAMASQVDSDSLQQRYDLQSEVVPVCTLDMGPEAFREVEQQCQLGADPGDYLDEMPEDTDAFNQGDVDEFDDLDDDEEGYENGPE